MRLHWPGSLLSLLLAVVLLGCPPAPRQLRIDIVDGTGTLGESHSAFALRARKEGASEEVRKEFVKDDCDLGNEDCEFTIRVDNPGQRDIWVEALDADNNVLARSYNLSGVNRNNMQIKAVLYRPCATQEECDLGDFNGNGCAPHSCMMERCAPQETLADGDACVIGTDIAGHCQDAVCGPASCGDGLLCSASICNTGPDGGVEECDSGSTNSDTDADACRENCALASCGDGIKDTDEACDDGNGVAEDGCAADCTAVESGWSCTEVEGLSQCAKCGNGIVEYSEECDGGAETGDKCPYGSSADCTVCVLCQQESGDKQYCGDGSIQSESGEECDDGNTSENDGCSSNCQAQAICGNSVVEEDEVCDTGGACAFSDNAGAVCASSSDCPGGSCVPSSLDGCAVNCKAFSEGWNCTSASPSVCTPVCGDGEVLGSEGCDDGDEQSNDGCSSSCEVENGWSCTQSPSLCVASACGDGIRAGAEECDDGSGGTAVESATCDVDCTLVVCGDGDINTVAGETCDDDNGVTESCDYGETSCTVCGETCQEVAGVVTFCGDNVLQSEEGEACDDGNTSLESCFYGETSCTVCNETCQEVAGAVLSCGDGIEDITSTSCTTDANCTSAGYPAHIVCGANNFCREECDAGEANSDDEPNACRENCLDPDCGDGVQDQGEGCDDGNTENNDGCSDGCALDTCGNGVTNDGEDCDDGDGDNNDGCLETCVGASCGDGFIWNTDGGTETCDDGNGDSGDGCSDACALESGWSCATPGEPCATTCGDGITAGTESCDGGSGNTPAYTAECDEDCTLSACGDGDVNSVAGESCDDGDDDLNDNCPDGVNGLCVSALCGDGFLCTAEEECTSGPSGGVESCDDGNGASGDGCSNCAVEAGWLCATPGQACTPICGDGNILGDEVCDDGNTEDGDYCSADCSTVIGSCGDGTIQSNESCDDSNTTNGDGCSADCDYTVWETDALGAVAEGRATLLTYSEYIVVPTTSGYVKAHHLGTGDSVWTYNLILDGELAPADFTRIALAYGEESGKEMVIFAGNDVWKIVSMIDPYGRCSNDATEKCLVDADCTGDCDFETISNCPFLPSVDWTEGDACAYPYPGISSKQVYCEASCCNNFIHEELGSDIAGLAASPHKDKRIKGLVSGQNGAMMHFDECGSTLDFSDFGRASNWISSGTCSENQVTCRSDDDCSGETNTCTNLFDPLVEYTGPLILSYSGGSPADPDEISALLLPQQEEVNAFVGHVTWLQAGGPGSSACTSPVTVDLSGEEDVVLPIVFLPALDGYNTGGDMNGHFFSVDRTNRLRQHFPIYGSCPDVAGMWEHADSPQMDYEVPVSPLVIWNSAKDEATDTSARDLIYVYLVDTGIDGSDVVQGATIKRIDTTIYRRCGGDLQGDPCLTVADCTAQSCLAPTGNDHLWQDGASATLSAESIVVSPVLDADGDVYVATKTTEDKGRIYKFNEDLQHQWGDDTTPEPLEFDNPIAAMLVSSSSTYPDGLLYAVTTEGILYAIERGGKAAEESGDAKVNTAWSRPGGSNDNSSYKKNTACGQTGVGFWGMMLTLIGLWLIWRRLRASTTSS